MMGGDGMLVKKARTHVHDAHRHVFLNRGMFVKAPPQFFQFYGSDFEPLTPKEARAVAEAPAIKLRTYADWGKSEAVEPHDKSDMPTTPSAPMAAATSEPPMTSEVPVVAKAKKARTALRKVVVR